jgi:hypothetical protein
MEWKDDREEFKNYLFWSCGVLEPTCTRSSQFCAAVIRTAFGFAAALDYGCPMLFS